METELGILTAVVMGLLLGLKHATDADHVVAVATIVKDSKNAWRSIWVGASWGFGHSTPLVILGVAILFLDDQFFDLLCIYFDLKALFFGSLFLL